MYGVKFEDLFNILDRSCGCVYVYNEYDNACIFSTSHASVCGTLKKDFENVKDKVVVQVTNYNGDEWKVYVR
ncbi:MAG: hypothetical protein E7231_00350 [Cellulosilyticum sp.]|nr:hypothetical protein [Cellulosilyticum sp.]